MFDIRPSLRGGGLNWKKIYKVRKNWRYTSKNNESFYFGKKIHISGVDEKTWQFETGRKDAGTKIKKSLRSVLGEKKLAIKKVPVAVCLSKENCIQTVKEDVIRTKVEICKNEKINESIRTREELNAKKNKHKNIEIKTKSRSFFHRADAAECKFSLRDLFLPARLSFGFNFKRSLLAFVGSGFMAITIVGGTSFLDKGIKVKSNAMEAGDQAYENIMQAVENIKNNDFEASINNFEDARNNFAQASEEMEELGGAIISASKYLPFASKLSSGKNIVEAGEYFSSAGKNLNLATEKIYHFKSKPEDLKNTSLLDIFLSVRENLDLAMSDLKKAQKKIDLVKVDDLPEDKREKFVETKSKAVIFTNAIALLSENSHIFIDLLGGNGLRKYLFLFQNNNEMRATGGFIGSYGLLEISNGNVDNFFIDGIFNPDGQLRDKIVPPKPVQKISAAWSLHDSNWFPDFPVSAEKAILFYEKTGGPTVDGVITLTPYTMEKLLALVGPIEMPEYETVLTSDNFVEKTQFEVEIDYDKKENKPKKILSDLAPIILKRLTDSTDPRVILGALEVLIQSLEEKHILFYSRNEDLQNMISQRGWSGEILQTQGDYLSVINTNINGYKTDGVVDEKIEHKAEIQVDGSIIDTVEITRKHNGGNSQYDWWNKVNSNYMRVYVPVGSRLLEIDGQTVEFSQASLDYSVLKFKEDVDVKKEEDNMIINQEDGVRTYQDAEKTVFAFWTYVSPQENIVVRLKYVLPFRLDFQDGFVNSYSLLAQKQSGSRGSDFSSQIKYPDGYDIEWKYPENIVNENGILKQGGKLNVDNFSGLVIINDKMKVK
ncbi:MAG: hypothetical protein UR69_C0001G0245 [Candidatus Moranbacteria bacterium GW2011_GWE2_35_2-]|nr:MAG: hypothetical protein UR69_C0001G0245 [Candidatus Moranbacteria bacterium GW2011_GWE2_35_2-]KKQ22757.1 MAG: hypothetical protein US37_C0001G0029 [Candidatus Moranbacteria bacterium GW2011_GWF2_37_11]KKQ28911.1 MAG: hypothetical protein US44_C0005G0053 [Candidatus Moranbacteria bacterium GW2011_GWD1_37_17]KKQ31012.1 MAG: hypothetical protein US47_C0001G0245 [Candidatus Moranbacteria bacterium GW2011_GWE1_37_24]KKQ48074.1 MAG: hypothetical protein US66_C0002G0018 [Candidatus Moranbacteria 